MPHACTCRFPVSILMSFPNKKLTGNNNTQVNIFIVNQNKKWDCCKPLGSPFPDAFYYEKQTGLVLKKKQNKTRTHKSEHLSLSQWTLENLKRFLKPEVRPKLKMWSPQENRCMLVKKFFSLKVCRIFRQRDQRVSNNTMNS